MGAGLGTAGGAAITTELVLAGECETDHGFGGASGRGTGAGAGAGVGAAKATLAGSGADGTAGLGSAGAGVGEVGMAGGLVFATVMAPVAAGETSLSLTPTGLAALNASPSPALKPTIAANWRSTEPENNPDWIGAGESVAAFPGGSGVGDNVIVPTELGPGF